MFDHVTLRATDLGASERFYRTALGVLGVEPTAGDVYREWRDFSIAAADAGHPATTGLHIGFAAATPELVDAFWRAGVDAGYESDGEPGPRPEYGDDYYGGFLLDPDGNSAEAVNLDGLRVGGIVDHLWIRVGDLEAAGRFYDTIGPSAGFRRHHVVEGEGDARIQFRGANPGSFSLVSDGRPRTEHLHLAFAAGDDRTVQAFHATALDAGYRSNG